LPCDVVDGGSLALHVVDFSPRWSIFEPIRMCLNRFGRG
jgi:hypothetical protein